MGRFELSRRTGGAFMGCRWSSRRVISVGQLMSGILDYRSHFLPDILHVGGKTLEVLADGGDLAI